MAEAAAFKAMMASSEAEGGGEEGAEEQRGRRRSPSLLADVVDAPADDDGEEEEEEEEEEQGAAVPAPAPAAQTAGDGDESEESLERALEEASAARGRGQAAAAAAADAAAAAPADANRQEQEPERAAKAAEGAATTATAAAAAAAETETATAAAETAAAAAPPPPPPHPHPRPRPPPPPPSPSPPTTAALRRPCRSVDSFERLAKISEGTYGVVYKARDRETGEVVALKKIKMDPGAGAASGGGGGGGGGGGAGDWGFPLTSIREINVLLSLSHENIVRVSEVVVGGGGGGGVGGAGGGGSSATLNSSVYLAMEWCDHDLCALQEAMRRPFTIAETKCVMRQLLAGVAHLHDSWVLHRDIKTANILYSNRGGSVKLADFGLARAFGSPLRPYTQPVVTLYYRAPELLLGSRRYSAPVDVWSLGCVMGELLLGRVMLSPDRSFAPSRGGEGGGGGAAAAADDGSIAQMNSIAALLGPVDEATWPGSSALPGLRSLRYPHRGRGLRSLFPAPGAAGAPNGGGGGGILADASQRLSGAGLDLLGGMLRLDPRERLSAAEALEHPWFDEFPRATERALMPTFPESGRR